MFDLNQPADRALNKEEASDVLQKYMQSAGVMMVYSSHPVTTVDIPAGTGAVDPNPMKR